MPMRHAGSRPPWPHARLAAALLGIGAALASLAPAAAAETCSPETVVARGEVSRFAWVARQKARGNWRHRVRLTPGLGDPYANWLRAADAEESCLSGPAGTVCTLSGRPCRQ